MSIFREYDIRGIVGTELTAAIAERIGLAYGNLLRENGGRVVSVGRDARTSSPELFEALVRGLSGAGLEAVDIGVCPTPLLYFSLFHLPVQGGIMITGSHNPGNYNGFKMCVGRDALYGEAIQDLRRRMENATDRPSPGKKPVLRKEAIIPSYQAYLRKQFEGWTAGGRTVVLDSGNGTAGIVAPDVFRSLGCRVVELYSDPDGRFPNHHPDPTVQENLSDLIEAVRREKAAFGVGYDGDADRIGVVDDRGSVLWGDQLLILFSRDILRTNPGATILSEVKASQLLFDDIRDKGGRGIMWRTGHSLIKAKMKEESAVLAGEMSGHLFFADRYFGYDDAIYASVRLLELLVRAGRPLSTLLSDLPRTHSTPEIRVDCPDEKKFQVVERLKKTLNEIRYSLNGPQGTVDHSRLTINDLITIDGVRVVFDGGWGLVRASNTQPALVLRFEADSADRLGRIRDFVESRIKM